MQGSATLRHFVKSADFLNKKNLFVFSANCSIINFDYLGLHEYKAENKLKVTASIQWWDDDGGVSGQDGSQEIGISDEWLASLDMSLIVTCYNGEIKICSKDNDIDKATKGVSATKMNNISNSGSRVYGQVILDLISLKELTSNAFELYMEAQDKIEELKEKETGRNEQQQN